MPGTVFGSRGTGRYKTFPWQVKDYNYLEGKIYAKMANNYLGQYFISWLY